MVNFILIVDANSKRRQSYLEKIKPLLPPVEGLVTSSCSNEDFGAIWAAGVWTPISHLSDKDGVAIIFGDAIQGPGPERLTAEELRNLWNGSKLPSAFDGFHAAVVFSSNKGILAGADVLGIFPLYYFASDEVILVGSSQELFRYHPCFEMQFNPEGLVGIFLTKGLFDGQTLFRGVKRLTPGHLLNCRLGKSAKEVLQFQLPVSSRYFDLKISEQVEVLDQAVSDAVSRHVLRDEKHCLMLSGGLDTRLLGGYLRQKKLDVTAFTEGLPTDNEMKCAIPVANKLEFNHVQINMGYDGYPRFARLDSQWQHLCAGFGGILYWGFNSYLRKIARRVIAGYFATEVLGGLFDSQDIPKPGGPVSFELLFKYNRWVFRPEILRMLLKEEFQCLVSEILRKIKKAYESYPGLEFQRVWCTGLHNRMRFHVGNIQWLLSFGSWPVLPFADRKVLEVAGGLPIEALVNRRLERELLIRKFPHLARLPLVAEIYDTTPLVPTPRQKSLQQIYGSGGIWRSKGTRYLRHLLIVGLRGERRYYARLWDITSPGWKAVRKMAEPSFNLTSPYLNESMVRTLMPSPNSRYTHVKRTMGLSGTMNTEGQKALMGFAVWLQQHSNAL